ncbi:RES family NAD+ phosphorylase [Hymenobacter arizonensis]|uniref:RES family NAD+ phosphorylase n=1 Tax=Hymenobacter arizonensis TaxID=1227077 RepID=UPI0015A59908|nr:RES family NAD+ phosphorylase [Hymenobacter arizonensis]
MPAEAAASAGYSLDGLGGSIGPLSERLLIDFGPLLFNTEDPIKVQKLLEAIFEEELADYRVVFSEVVLFEHLCDFSAYEDYHKLATEWENFVNEIKNQNRFHLSSQVNLKAIERLLGNHVKHYPAGKIFYRGRISESNGYVKEEMGNPPSASARPGRANPAGISYLYLAEGIATTLYETRAALFDYVSIGEFTANQEIRVINLREPQIYDPLQLAEAERLKDFLLHLPFLQILEKELSKPVRRSDNELDYLPTQYLSEFIKSLGYDGVEYRSSLNPSGYNVAIFNPEKFECKKAYVHEIHKISFSHSKL